MSDAYRTAAFPCPVCTNATLREFHERLVCDECNGMLIAADDIAESIRELDASEDTLEITDDKPGDTRCPLCSNALAPCTVKFGTMKVNGAFLHCATHGLWFPRDAMTALFARVSRRGRLRGSTGGTRGGLPGGGARGDGLGDVATAIRDAFQGHGPASSGLAIGNWEHRRPRVHTLFVSAHKDRRLGCPSCKENPLAYRGDRWACGTCAGSFVEHVALAAMVEEMAQKP